MLPTFIGIGPGRTGTTWLYEVLRSHPEVALADGIKETEFFDNNFEKGVVWYQRFFPDSGFARAAGEITNRYIFCPRVPERIYSLLPNCKIIVGIRNPYDRIQSNYSFKLREGSYKGSFDQALRDMPQIIDENRYMELLKPYLKLFGRENVFFMVFDDVESRPHELCRDLFTFLGIDATYMPTVAFRKINGAVIPRFPLVAFTTKTAARFLRRVGLYRFLTAAKRSIVIKHLLFRRFDYRRSSIMSSEARSTLAPIFDPEINELEVLLGRSFDNWRV